MFNLSGSEIVVILLLALVVLGPEKLPDAIRRAGRTYAELKKMGNSFQSEMRSVLDEPMKEMRETADLLRQSADFTDGELTSAKTASPPRLKSSGGRTTSDATAAGTAPAAGTAAANADAANTDATNADATNATAPSNGAEANGRATAASDGPDSPTAEPSAAAQTAASDAGTSVGTPRSSSPTPGPQAGDDDPDQALINRTLSGGQ